MAAPGDNGKARKAHLHQVVWRAVRPPVLLSLAQVRESGLPAFFFDYGESLVYWDDELFDIHDWGDALQTGVDPTALPPAVLEHAIGIEHGWRHANACTCGLCRRRPGH
jgi:hypothetical protein